MSFLLLLYYSRYVSRVIKKKQKKKKKKKKKKKTGAAGCELPTSAQRGLPGAGFGVWNLGLGVLGAGWRVEG